MFDKLNEQVAVIQLKIDIEQMTRTALRETMTILTVMPTSSN